MAPLLATTAKVTPTTPQTPTTQTQPSSQVPYHHGSKKVPSKTTTNVNVLKNSTARHLESPTVTATWANNTVVTPPKSKTRLEDHHPVVLTIPSKMVFWWDQEVQLTCHVREDSDRLDLGLGLVWEEEEVEESTGLGL